MAKKDVAEKASAKPKKAEKKQKVGFLKKMTRYFRDLRGEYKKIVWPTKSRLLTTLLLFLQP